LHLSDQCSGPKISSKITKLKKFKKGNKEVSIEHKNGIKSFRNHPSLISSTRVSQKSWKSGKKVQKCLLHTRKFSPRYVSETRKNNTIIRKAKVNGDCLQTNENTELTNPRQNVKSTTKPKVSNKINRNSTKKVNSSYRIELNRATITQQEHSSSPMTSKQTQVLKGMPTQHPQQLTWNP
jgi:hypothetical protein